MQAKSFGVIGVSADPVNNLKRFRNAHHLNFTLLSDVNGFIARWTFILGKDGNILYKDTQVDAPNDSRKAIEFLRSLK